MNKLIALFIIIAGSITIAGLAHGADILADTTLTWDANPEPEITGYKLYVGTNSGIYTDTYTVTNGLIQQLTNLDVGVRYFAAVSAHAGTNKSSQLSSEINWLTPVKPKGLRVITVEVKVTVTEGN